MFHSHKVFKQLDSRLNYFKQDALWQLHLDRSRINKARGSRILVYHGVCTGDPFRFNTLFVTLKNFEKQLQLYKKYFQVVSLDDYYRQNFSTDKFAICLSFDDGFANNYKYVLPLLEKYEVPASFFITSIRKAGYDVLWNDVLSIAVSYGPGTFEFKGEKFLKSRTRKYISTATGRSLNEVLRETHFEDKVEMIERFKVFKEGVDKDYWLQMTEEEIRQMSLSKWVTIGSHSYYHNDLANMSGRVLEEDLLESKKYLEELTGKEVKAMAFPYGSYSKEAVQQAKAVGYTQLLATEFLYPDDAKDQAMKERLTINPFISAINQMHANISGHY